MFVSFILSSLVLVGWWEGRLVCTDWVLVHSWWWLELCTFRDDCCRCYFRHLLLQNDSIFSCQLTEVVLNVKMSVFIVALLLDCELLSYYVCLWPWVSFGILLYWHVFVIYYLYGCVHQNIMWHVNIFGISIFLLVDIGLS